MSIPTMVVLVPGVMATRLIINGRVWDPDDLLGLLRRWGPLTSATTQADMIATHRGALATPIAEPLRRAAWNDRWTLRGWGALPASYYLPLLERLNSLADGCDAFGFGYDWRQDNALSGDALADWLSEQFATTSYQQAIIVTHSMGGYVARWALSKRPELASRVLGVVHLCQPTHGAVTLLRRLHTGVNRTWDRGDSWIGDWGFAKVLGDSYIEFATIISGLPGPLQLLPNDGYWQYPQQWWLSHPPTRPTGGMLYDLYKPQAGTPPAPPLANLAEPYRQRLLDHIDRAATFHSALGGYFHPHSYHVAGWGRVTDGRIDFDNRGRPTGADLRPAPPNGEGDGTVPYSSVFPRGMTVYSYPRSEPTRDETRAFWVNGLEHSQACSKSSELQNLTAEIVEHLLNTRS